jgi:hypothetical protein
MRVQSLILILLHAPFKKAICPPRRGFSWFSDGIETTPIILIARSFPVMKGTSFMGS